MSTVTFPDWLAQQHPAIPLAGARAILALAEGGATVPFIARYRKEQTGGLDEVAIRAVEEKRDYLVELEDRRRTILSAI
ncbi:MAG TPA: Tex-like N-terminal domain-containing protein, partial [Polyangia bacterium]|nr:Tex-like N-terminal domain-containing protein [Polyangia bacterium]